SGCAGVGWPGEGFTIPATVLEATRRRSCVGRGMGISRRRVERVAYAPPPRPHPTLARRTPPRRRAPPATRPPSPRPPAPRAPTRRSRRGARDALHPHEQTPCVLERVGDDDVDVVLSAQWRVGTIFRGAAWSPLPSAVVRSALLDLRHPPTRASIGSKAARQRAHIYDDAVAFFLDEPPDAT